jgi:hypothetical protein
MKEFDKNASTYEIIGDLVEGQYYANGNSYSYSAGFLSSVLDEVIRQSFRRSKQEAMRDERCTMTESMPGRKLVSIHLK